jgi:hypothetical protein
MQACGASDVTQARAAMTERRAARVAALRAAEEWWRLRAGRGVHRPNNALLEKPTVITLKRKQAVAAFAALALVAGSVPAGAAQKEVRCDSRGLRHNYCRVDTAGRVELIHRHGIFSCNEGRSWGYDERGVWVDKGCSATFRVGRQGHNDKAVLAGAVVGLAALAALAATRHKAESVEVASWAVGSFAGDDAREGVRVSLRILPGGQVSGRAGDHDIAGHLQATRLEAGRQVFRIESQGNGFLAIDERDPTHRVTFTRITSEY